MNHKYAVLCILAIIILSSIVGVHAEHSSWNTFTNDHLMLKDKVTTNTRAIDAVVISDETKIIVHHN